MIKFKGFRIINFRSLYNVYLHIDSPLVVFIGKNSAGKSNIFHFFNFLKNTYIHGVEYAVEKEGGWDNIIHKDHKDPTEEPIFAILEFSIDVKGEELPLYIRYEICLNNKDRKTIKYKDNVDGDVLPHLQFNKAKYTALDKARDIVRDYFKNSNILNIDNKNDYKSIIESNKKDSLLCIEHLEDGMDKASYEFGMTIEGIRFYASRIGQVFLTTHSPDLINYLDPEEVCIVDKDHDKTLVNKVIDDDEIVKLVDGGDKLGRLWSEGILT